MEEELEQFRFGMIKTMRQRLAQAKQFPRQPDEQLRRPDLEHGWALPMLIDLDWHTNGRWTWWGKCHLHYDRTGSLPDSPIPELEWRDNAEPQTLKMLNACLATLEYGGSSGSQNVPYFLDWILFSLGSDWVKELPREPCKGASDRLYQIFCLDALLIHPYDYFGDLLSECQWGKSKGFFPTPMSVVKVMTAITMGQKSLAQRTKTVLDPCVGTGRMLMLAGDYSLRLHGQDIDGVVLKAANINFLLYVPWAIAPIKFPPRVVEEKARVFSPTVPPPQPRRDWIFNPQ